MIKRFWWKRPRLKKPPKRHFVVKVSFKGFHHINLLQIMYTFGLFYPLLGIVLHLPLEQNDHFVCFQLLWSFTSKIFYHLTRHLHVVTILYQEV